VQRSVACLLSSAASPALTTESRVKYEPALAHGSEETGILSAYQNEQEA